MSDRTNNPSTSPASPNREFPPSRFYDPWPWPEWTPEQWDSWSEDKQNAMSFLPGEMWFIWSKLDREDYQPRLPEFHLLNDLYLQALGL